MDRSSRHVGHGIVGLEIANIELARLVLSVRHARSWSATPALASCGVNAVSLVSWPPSVGAEIVFKSP